jgi:hypothetical protein
MRVFKYLIPVDDEPTVRLPLGARILSVGQQNGVMFLWALVNPGEQRTERRTLRVAGTGHEIADVDELQFIGTVHMHGGALVFHIFERVSAI